MVQIKKMCVYKSALSLSTVVISIFISQIPGSENNGPLIMILLDMNLHIGVNCYCIYLNLTIKQDREG